MYCDMGLYIHIPFCKSKCFYCDFNSYAGGEHNIPAYFDALKKEIRMYQNTLKGHVFNTVYIGGGTPSYVDPKYIYDVLDTCRHSFSISGDAEITLESNPGTLSFGNLVLYKSFGINRLSIGLQAMQDVILKQIGRIHTRNDFVGNYHTARQAGFKNISVDLIFGLPKQKLSDWTETVSQVIQLYPEHISCYGLIVEEGTELSNRMTQGVLCLPDEDEERQMYDTALKALKNAGYNQYEISNFAIAGMECRHNLNYWKCGQYIGIGAGAHSYFNDTRYWNIRAMEEYINFMSGADELPLSGSEKIDDDEKMKEFIILGLRMNRGVCKREFEQTFGQPIYSKFGGAIKDSISLKLMEDVEGRLRLTRRGLDLANEVLVKYV